jgi:hypothetical protein
MTTPARRRIAAETLYEEPRPVRHVTQFKKALFVATACALATALATTLVAGVYLFGVKHLHYTAVRPIFHLSSVRSYLFDARFRRFVELTNEEDAQQDDVFASIWDTSVGTLLSRQMFHPVEMYGVQKYMYNPGLVKLSFTLDVDGFRRSFEMVDSPSLRRTIDELHAVKIYTASYDGFGFRRVDAELMDHCDVRVLFLGDSFTDGVYVADHDTAVNRYGHIARERSRIAVCPINTGVDGYGTLEEAFVLTHYFERLDRPPVAIVMHFPNDVDGNANAVVDGSMADASREWTDNLAYLKRIVDFGRQHATKVVVVAIPLARQSKDPSTRKNYQDVLRGFCEREGVRFVDLLDGLAGRDVHEIYLEGDPHWTVAGHDGVARVLYEQTKDLLVPAAAAAARR